MKRFLAMVMIVVLLVGCIPLTALAYSWTCPWCGQHNTKYENVCQRSSCDYSFSKESSTWTCPECGFYNTKHYVCFGSGCTYQRSADLLYSTSSSSSSSSSTYSGSSSSYGRTFQITSVKVNDNGTLMVYWEDSANKGPYTLKYEQWVSDTYTSDAQNKIFRYTALDSTYNMYGKIKFAEPCTNYWISLYDKDGTCVRYAYKPSRFRNFTEFGVNLEPTLTSQRGSSKANLKRFSAWDIENDNRSEWSVKIKMTHSQLRKKRALSVHLAIHDPKDKILTVFFDSGMTMPRGVSSTSYTLTLNDAFETAKEIYGYVPTGQYTINIYFDGLYVNSTTFRVGQ